MKAPKRFLPLLAFFSFISSAGFAQEHTLRDQAEITYQAQLTLSTYNQLLNVIASPDITTADVNLLIENSYSDPQTQVFYSADAIIEDNVKPSNLDSRLEQDKSIKDYLRYFDLTYEKSGEETVQFSDFQTSNLKQGDYLYMKVKYTCSFKGRNKEDTVAYHPVERLAEVRVVKTDKQWKTYITSIVFYDPLKPFDEAGGDVALDQSVTDDGTFSHLINKLQSSHNSLDEQQQKAEYVAFNNRQDSLFTHYMEAGSLAMEAEKFDEAFEAFSEASRISPWNLELRQKMVDLTKAQSRQSRIEEKEFNEAVLFGDRAKAVRDYAKAKNFYAEALRIRPQETSIKERIRNLEKVIQIVAIPESKYSVGAYKDAMKDYDKALKEKEFRDYFPDFYFGRGKAYEKMGDTKDAIKDYSKAIEADGNFIEALHRRAVLYFKNNEPHKAIADYSLIISNPDYAADFYPERAKVRTAIEDYSGALEDYDAAINLKPAVASNYYSKGLIQYGQKELEPALQSFSLAIEQDSEFVDALYQRGLVYIDLRKVEPAAVDFAKVRALGGEDYQLTTIKHIANNFFSMGEGNMKMQAYADASECYGNALLVYPEYGSAWLRKGDADAMLAHYQDAIASYDNAIAYDSVSLAYFRRGQAYQKIHEVELATKDFSRYVDIGQTVASMAEQKAQSRSASLSQVRLLEQEQAEALYALGYAQLMTEQYEDAYESLKKAVKLKKDYPLALFARGSARFYLGDYKKAVKDMEESIKRGLADPAVFFSLGMAYEERGKLDDAIKSYTHTIELDENFVDAYRQRAICYKKEKEYELAIQDIEAVFLINEALREDVNLIVNKGMVELYQYKYENALHSFDQALIIDESEAWALYGKACALAHLNKVDDSMEFYQKAFQTKEIEWSSIKKDSLIKPVKKEKRFKELVRASF